MQVRVAPSHRLPMRRVLPSQMERQDLLSVGGKAAFIVLLHALGWGGTLLLAPASRPVAFGAEVTLAGLGLTAYLLGLRHAFDADHIAAIDGVTRTLVQQGRPAASVGFWFSLGHCSFVFVLSGLVTAGVHSLAAGPALDSAIPQMLGPAGALVAGLFLYVIGLANLRALLGALKRHGLPQASSSQGEAAVPAIRTPISLLLGRTSWMVDRPGGMFLVGMLFGLGLDTAMEVAFLSIAAGGLLPAVPCAPVVLPVLFAAGMMLLDTLNGCFISAAYSWASSWPTGRSYYNILVTAVAVTAAFAVGSLQLASVIASPAGRAQALEAGWGIISDGGGYLLAWIFLFLWAASHIRHRRSRAAVT